MSYSSTRGRNIHSSQIFALHSHDRSHTGSETILLKARMFQIFSNYNGTNKAQTKKMGKNQIMKIKQPLLLRNIGPKEEIEKEVKDH